MTTPIQLNVTAKSATEYVLYSWNNEFVIIVYFGKLVLSSSLHSFIFPILSSNAVMSVSSQVGPGAVLC